MPEDIRLQQAEKHNTEVTERLDALLVQNEKNNPEPILEAIAVNTKPKDVQKMELVTGDENEIAKTFWHMLRGQKGEKGDKGDKGDTGEPLTWNDLTAEQRASLKGDQGNQGAAGAEGPAGTDGRTVIGPVGPQGEPGEPGKSITGPKGRDGKDGSPDTPQEIVAKISSLEGKERLSYEALKDLPNLDFFRGGGSDNAILVQDEGVLISGNPVRFLNFTGAGVSVSHVNGIAVIQIAGGAGNTPRQETPSGSINGTNAIFTLSNTPVANTLLLYLNNIFVHPSEYSLVGTTITFTTAPDSSLSGTGFTAIYES